MLRQRSSHLQSYKSARMSRRIAVEQRRYAAGMADTRDDSLKLAKQKIIWNAHKARKKSLFFCYVTISPYVQLLGGQNRCEIVWAVVINPPKLPINDEGRYDAHIASTGVRLY